MFLLIDSLFSCVGLRLCCFFFIPELSGRSSAVCVLYDGCKALECRTDRSLKVNYPVLYGDMMVTEKCGDRVLCCKAGVLLKVR